MSHSASVLSEKLVNTLPDFREVFIRPLENQSCHNLPPTQIHAMMYIYKYPRITMSQLSEGLGVSKQQLTKIVAALMCAGYAKRTVDSQNLRVAYVELTKEGVKTLVSIQKCAAEQWIARLSSLSESQLDDIIEALGTLQKLLNLT